VPKEHLDVLGGIESGLALISGDVVGIKVLVPSLSSFVEPPIGHTTSLIDLLQRPLEICR
jgi:hypothetical protein